MLFSWRCQSRRRLVVTCPRIRRVDHTTFAACERAASSGVARRRGARRRKRKLPRERCWRLVAQRAVRPLLVVFYPPRGDLLPRVPQVFKPIHVQAFIPQLAVETFHVPVLLRLSRLDVHQRDLLLDAPRQKMPAGELRSVVADESPAVSSPRRGWLSSSRVTRRLAILVSTSRAGHSRVYSSSTVSTRIARPLASASCAKSTAHSWFAAVSLGCGEPSRISLLRAFRRTASPASRYTVSVR